MFNKLDETQVEAIAARINNNVSTISLYEVFYGLSIWDIYSVKSTLQHSGCRKAFNLVSNFVYKTIPNILQMAVDQVYGESKGNSVTITDTGPLRYQDAYVNVSFSYQHDNDKFSIYIPIKTWKRLLSREAKPFRQIDDYGLME